MHDFLFYGLTALLIGFDLYVWQIWKFAKKKTKAIALYVAQLLQWLAALALASILPSTWWNWITLPNLQIWQILILFFCLELVRLLLLPLFKQSPSETTMSRFDSILKIFFFWMQDSIEQPTEELELLSETISENEEQLEVIENALDLGETTLGEICTHRSDMVILSLKDEPSKWKKTILAHRHTFYPVTNESDDDVIGFLDTRDYFRMPGFGKKQILDECVDKPLFAAENTTADELLRIMKSRKKYIAIVLDEYGGVVGLVTLHDIIEELLGELSEEEEKRQADIVKLPRGLWRISGEANLKDVSKALNMNLELDDFETFSGYVIGSMGYIPEDGTQLEVQIDHLMIQIKRIAGHRIRQALVHKIDEPIPTPNETH